MWGEREALINDRVRRLVPAPFATGVFIGNVAHEIGKPVHWIPSLSPGTGMTGLSVRCQTTGAAVIFTPADAPPEYAAHCVGHECWHLLEGHLCSARDASSATRNRRRPGWMAHRREREAERFAKRIGLAAAGSTRLAVSDERTRRLAAAFGLYAG